MPTEQRNASPACLGLIKRREDEPGWKAGRCSRLVAYRCPAGVWTIAWGHTAGVEPGMTVTPDLADALLLEDVRAVEAELRPMLAGVPLTQGQWDALVSLCFNLKGGPRALPTTAPKLWKALHAGDKTAAVIEFGDMDRARCGACKGRGCEHCNYTGRITLAGLTARRKAEAALFMS
jgi:lysozyme